MTNKEELVSNMKILLASVFTFYMKTHQFHFNVTGPNFTENHEFFGDLYEDIWESFDSIGEQIRQLGAFTPVSYTRFQELTKISEVQTIYQSKEMFIELYRDNEIILSILKNCFKSAEELEELGTSNFIQDRIQAHKKHSWMLKATIGIENE